MLKKLSATLNATFSRVILLKDSYCCWKSQDLTSELEFIDFGAEEIFADEDGILIYAPFESFGAIQKELENRGIEILSSGFERIPQITKKLNEAEIADVEKLIEKIEEDDDVMNVYHTMDESE